MNILGKWPFPYQPRQNQIDALEWLAEQKAKYLLLEAPVGSGKSNIGLTLSRYLGSSDRNPKGVRPGNSFILTPQRILQEQYERSVKDVKNIYMASFYGKGNYECKKKNTACDIGNIMKKPKCHYCPFQEAKRIAQQAADTVLNYKLALTSFAYTKTFGKRSLMILDECHTLEQHLVDFDAFKVLEGRCKKYGVPFKTHKLLQDALEWVILEYVTPMRDACMALERECEPLFDRDAKTLTKTELRKIRELTSLQDHVDEAVEMALRPPEVVEREFVLVWDKTSFQFKRLLGKYSFNKIVNPKAKKFLFMSSTILDKEGFCEDLGLPEEDTAFLSLPSEFDIKNRPVTYMPQTKMNVSWKKEENKDGRLKMLAAIEKLSEMHSDESGIIHTGNFEIAKWLVENLSVSQKIYHHNPGLGDDRNSVITAFQGDPKPSILISPSSTEGLDLKDNLGRFAIFAKIPFGHLGDQWIKRRQEMSNEWYQRRALIDIIQGGGRIVRSDTDHGSVYILDQSWAYLYKCTLKMLPRWWKDAYRVL